jgi:hypothetical protein
VKKLTQGDVERLLRDAADWEPNAPPPPMSLPEFRRHRVAPGFWAAGLPSLAVAVVAAGWQLLPKPAPTVVALRPVPAFVVTTPTPVTSPAPVRVAQEPESEPTVPRYRRRPSPSVERNAATPERRPRRKRNWIGSRRTRKDRTEYAPYRYVLSSQPLPKDAITLEDIPRVVPVVVTDRDGKTGEVQLIPAAAVVADLPENTYSLE